MKSFSLNKEQIYRDTNTWYKNFDTPLVNPINLNLVKRYAGLNILDVGCATGGYCIELKKSGYNCIGVDINKEYVRIARKNGINVCLIKDEFPFKDNSFDTVLLFEIIEHLEEPGRLLKEAKRVAKKNILISVPNCEGFEALRKYGLTYEHFLEMDHKNFFTRDLLAALLSRHFNNFIIKEVGSLFPLLLNLDHQNFIGKISGWSIRKFIGLCYKLKILNSSFYTGLQAVVIL
ncbi:MAG: class I SAM-dependent methyltransferase [bacterium]